MESGIRNTNMVTAVWILEREKKGFNTSELDLEELRNGSHVWGDGAGVFGQKTWMDGGIPSWNGKAFQAALPGPGQFGVFTLEMNLLKEIS